MPVDRGKGSFRLAWVAVSLIGLAALIVASAVVLGVMPRRRKPMDEFDARPGWPFDGPAVGTRRPVLDRGIAQLLLALRGGAALRPGPGEDRQRLSCARAATSRT